MLQGFKDNGLTDLDQAEQAGAEAGFPIKVPQPLLRVQWHLRQHLVGFRSATATLKRAHRCAGYNHAAERNDSYYSQAMSSLAKPLRAACQMRANFSDGPDPFDMKLLAGESPIPARESVVAVAATPRHENRQSRRARTKREGR